MRLHSRKVKVLCYWKVYVVLEDHVLIRDEEPLPCDERAVNVLIVDIVNVGYDWSFKVDLIELKRGNHSVKSNQYILNHTEPLSFS